MIDKELQKKIFDMKVNLVKKRLQIQKKVGRVLTYIGIVGMQYTLIGLMTAQNIYNQEIEFIELLV